MARNEAFEDVQQYLCSQRITMANFISAEFGMADFVLLEEISTETFMANLKLRYTKGKIYSYIGEVVVSVNPYRNMVIYDKEFVEVSVRPADSCLYPVF